MIGKKEVRRLWLSLLLNVLTVLVTAIGTVLHYASIGWAMFQYYTLCSNVFLLAASLLVGFYDLCLLLKLRFFIPGWVRLVKYFAVCTVMVTFFVVVLVLGPMVGGVKGIATLLFRGGMIWHHFFGPLLGLFSLILLDGPDRGDRRLPLLATLFTLLYAAVVTVLNLLRVIHGPYPFLYVYEQPVWASVLWYVAIWLLAWLLAAGVWKLCRRLAPKRELPPASPLPESRGYTADGYICDQDCFSAYTYRLVPASGNGCGCVAAYNLRRRRGQEVSFGEVVQEMDRLHTLHMPGPTHTRVLRRYLRRYLPGMREAKGLEPCLAAARTSGMGILRYREKRVPHFVSFLAAEREGEYRFFNVCDGMEDAVLPMERFMREHCTEGPVRLFYWDKE